MERIRTGKETWFRKEKKKESAATSTDGKITASSTTIQNKESAEENKKIFSSTFQGEVEKNLEELIDDVHQSGEQLKEKPTIDSIRKYKKHVAQFLDYIVRNTLETETIQGAKYNPLKKQKKYTLIRTVNEKLELLANGIIKNQRDNIEILRKVDEIYGLLIDLKG